MGLSTKQVSSSEGHGWNQALLQASNLELPKLPLKRQTSSSSQQQQQQEDQQLKCPRCESTNTKFCYYNNYNKSQPRHFCKACKRHWTKGGTLRNVPIGGGRKNKRKTASKNATKTTTTTTSTTSKGVSNNNMTVQQEGQQPNNLNMWDTPSLHHDADVEAIIQSPSILYSSLEETVMNNNMSIMSTWSMGVDPTSSNSVMDIDNMLSNWGWDDDFDQFVSVDADLITIPWDDPEIKP